MYINPLGLLFLNIGQGDAIYLETPGGYRILVDGGPDNKILNYLGSELPFYSKKIFGITMVKRAIKFMPVRIWAGLSLSPKVIINMQYQIVKKRQTGLSLEGIKNSEKILPPSGHSLSM